MPGSASITVAALTVFPVKGLRGNAVDAAEMQRCGLAGDRRWMVTTPDGIFLTQRQLPTMARIAVRRSADGLVLDAPGAGSIAVAEPPPDAERIEVTVWRDRVAAAPASAEAAGWLGAVLGTPCRLVHLGDPLVRPVDPDYAAPDDRVSFADGFPVLLAGEASLADLNTRLARSIPMSRFRPNLVISGADAWAEDGWRRIAVGEAIFRIVKPCARCAVTTVDQDSGTRPVPDEPLRTLATFRKAKGGVMFGQNLIPDRLGRIAVGDVVTVMEEGASNLVRAA